MKQILEDIRERIRRNEYRNEEHVRLCIVARVLESLGWNIWDPTQVDAECVAAPLEDRTKVDFALYSREQSPNPYVFIEVKRVGKVELDEVEKQLRDYNRNHTAPFSVITDGQRWWFYYSQTGGEFRDKRFATIDLLDSTVALEKVVDLLQGYLGKSAVTSDKAEERAKSQLRLSQKRKAFLECLQEARRLVQEPPYPALPAVVVQLMKGRGYEVNLEEARELLKSLPSQSEPPPSSQALDLSPPAISQTMQRKSSGTVQAQPFQAASPPDLRFTAVDDATFGREKCSNWNGLVEAALRCASSRQLSLARVIQVANINLEQGGRSDSGFRSVSGTTWSYQNKDAGGAWRAAFALAVELRQPIAVHFRWRDKEGAANRNQLAIMRWSP